MGCPVKKVTRNGAGSALLLDPDRVGLMIEDAGGEWLACYDKFDLDGMMIKLQHSILEESLKMLASLVALHARTRAQGYSGHADWSPNQSAG